MSPEAAAARVMMVTGEASGDLHGAKVIRAVHARNPEIAFFGAGGRRMAAEGCDILIPGEQLAVMGLVEVLGHFPAIWQAFQRLKTCLFSGQKPDLLVLIDFPEFNLRLARQAKRAGVPVLYYVSPQVWAWRRGRVKKIARLVDRLAAIFPFEPELYRDEQIDVEYVGHPLLDEFEIHTDPQALRQSLSIAADRTVVGLFPGSRRSELEAMAATLAATARALAASRKNLHFLVPVASTLEATNVAGRFDAELPITYVTSEQASIYDVAQACDAIATVSGTVTLQIALTGVPMAIFYQVAPLTYQIGRRLVRVDHIGLANIVAGKRVVREFVQHQATPANLAEEIERILADDGYAADIRAELGKVRDKLGQPGCSDRVARMIIEMVTPTGERS